jgi:signal transduction histidine kinase
VLTNAIQFSPAGGTVTVDAEEVASDGFKWIICTVGDSGPGFQTSDVEAVFEPFFSKRRGGTGLGLAIVRRVVEDHKGVVSVGNRSTGGGMARIKLRCEEGAVRDAK